MEGQDHLLPAIEAIYDAGLDDALWPTALQRIAAVVGGVAATLELFDRPTQRLIEFHSYGLPPAIEVACLDGDAAFNPRIPVLIHGRPGSIVTDDAVLDEAAMNRRVFYPDVRAPPGYRYFVGGILRRSECESSLFSVQRATRQGQFDRRAMARMYHLLPHVRQAFDMTRRLRRADESRHALERALDWLADGVVLLRSDGTIIYANDAFGVIARANDGIRIVGGVVELAAAEGSDRLTEALAGTTQARPGERGGTSADFRVSRPSGAPPYLLSVRPLTGRDYGLGSTAKTVVFVRDPHSRNAAAIRTLREVFGLTEAEAGVAQALQAGVTLGDYAAGNGVTLNTVYTHLRHIKEKTGCRRLPELIHELNDLRVPLRAERDG